MTTPTASTPATTSGELTATELDRAGLLHADLDVQISRLAIFVPGDALGTLRPIRVRTGAVIGAFSVVHGGTTVGEQARIEEHAVVDNPNSDTPSGGSIPVPATLR